MPEAWITAGPFRLSPMLTFAFVYKCLRFLSAWNHFQSDEASLATLFTLFKLLATVMVFRWLFMRDGPDKKLVKEATRTNVSDKDALARAYWKLHQETYVPNSRWILMRREEKAAIFAKREELEKYFESFSADVKQHARKMKPTPPSR